ncbi:odorant receptor 7a-like [Harpegnathos saltator]|uniref:odorant receptor 7a-like n=1 Tax=Harpegnathos saltator TaxID=610380 RepID=UPI000DBEDD23|nr:odorant receptor 7a-like [Harpegnathos saltator]
MSTSTTKCSICVKLCGAIKIHRRSLEFIDYFSTTFSGSYFILCGFAVASLSINLFRFMHAARNDALNEAISSGLFVYAHFCHVIWNNYFGQDLTDHSADMFAQIYNAQWYTAPLHVQKMILFILHRSAKNISFNVGSIFVLSLEGVATVRVFSFTSKYTKKTDCLVIYLI